MKRTVLIPLLLSTFLLVGCESELDRCIEGNFSVDIWEVREKYRLWSLEEEPRKRFSIERSFSVDERKVFICVDSRITNYMVFTLNTPVEEIEINIEMKAFDDLATDCIQKEKEKAKKICHRQGIY